MTTTGFTFHENPDGSPLTPQEIIFQALGAASVCWDRPEDAGVFHSVRAKAIGDAVCERLGIT